MNKTLLRINGWGLRKYVYYQTDECRREEFKINVITLVTLTDIYKYIGVAYRFKIAMNIV